MSCIFCKIINKEIPSKFVYEDEKVIAINDINPAAPVHVLVMPKEHIESANYLDEDNIEIVGDIFLAIKKIVKELGIDEKGYRVIMNCNEDGGQTVMHLHFHILGGIVLSEKII